jgi:hypothetical protein
MHRLATVTAVSGALIGLSLAAGCEETGYDDTTVDETETTAPTYDTDSDIDDTTPPRDTEIDQTEDREAQAPPQVPPTGEAETTLVGVLEQSDAAEGQPAEWVLTGTEQGDIKIDLTNVTEDVNALEGSRVLVTGELIERTDLEGVPMNVLVAERIEAT